MPLIGLVVSLGVLVSTVLSVRYHQLHADQFLPLEEEIPDITEMPTEMATLTAQGSDESDEEATDSPTATPSDSEGTPTAALTITTTYAPTATFSETPTATPSATPTATPTIASVSPTDVTSYTNGQLDIWFEQYANDYDVDSALLRSIAACESGFNATSHNVKYDYAGIFQFSAGAWTSARSRMGLDTNADLRFNAEESIKTAAWKIAHDGAGAWPNCGG